MSPVRFLLLVLCVRTAELRHLRAQSHPPGVELEAPRAEDAPIRAADSAEPLSPERGSDGRAESLRDARGGGARDGGSRRRDDPGGFFTTTRPGTERLRPGTGRLGPGPAAAANASSAGGSGLLNPLFPLTDGAYWAYAVMLLALVLFAAGIVGNLALMCIVWHNFYLKSAWNCVLAGLALWDFLVLFFCLPVVVFHELTLRRLLGDLSCRLVPYMEVTSLGVATFSLCALSIDRFHAATGPAPSGPAPSGPTPSGPAPPSPARVESCQSILSKLSVIWLGSMVLAAPELLLWQLQPAAAAPPAHPPPGAALMASFRPGAALQVDVCVREPAAAALPDGVLSLVLTYREARSWWLLGCYVCLPLLFTLACDLVTRKVLAQQQPAPPGKKKAKGAAPQQRLRAVIMALAALYAVCTLPESVCNIALSYVSAAAGPVLLVPALSLTCHFLLFARCAAAPLLLLRLCRPLGRAFMDCCCCCCDECRPDPAPCSRRRPPAASSSSSSSSSSSCGAATSTLSSPTSPTPSSLAPFGKDETMKSLLEAAGGEGTPC